MSQSGLGKAKVMPDRVPSIRSVKSRRYSHIVGVRGGFGIWWGEQQTEEGEDGIGVQTWLGGQEEPWEQVITVPLSSESGPPTVQGFL